MSALGVRSSHGMHHKSWIRIGRVAVAETDAGAPVILKLDTDVAAAKYQFEAHRAAQTPRGVGLVVKVLGYAARRPGGPPCMCRVICACVRVLFGCLCACIWGCYAV